MSRSNQGNSTRGVVPTYCPGSPDGPETPPSRKERSLAVFRNGWPVLAFDVAAPLAIYFSLTTLGWGPVPALLYSSLPPAVVVAVTAIRERRVSGISIIVLAGIATGAVMALLGGDARDVVARDAYPNAALGIAIGVSALANRRPLLFFLLRATGEDLIPGVRCSFDVNWQSNRFFRRFLRQASAVACLVLVGEAVVRIVMARREPIGLTLAVFNVEGMVVWAVLVFLLVRGLARVKARGEAEATVATC